MRLLLKTAIPIFVITFLWLIILSTDQPFDCDDLHCWDGITPGETTFDEAQIILEHLHTKQNVSVFPDGIVWSQRHDQQSTGYLPSMGNIVNRIQLYLIDSPYTLADIVAKHGQPQQVILPTNQVCGEIRLYFDKEVIVIVWLEPLMDNRQLFPDQEVDLLVLGSDQFLFDQIETTAVFDWQGYTDYCDLIDAP